MQHRVLSGIQPSGSQHIGHLVGALDNFTRLQGQGEAFYMIADWHALTSKYESVEEIWPATLELSIPSRRRCSSSRRGRSTPNCTCCSPW